MTVAIASSIRLIIASEIAFDWPASIPFAFQAAGLFACMRATRAKTRQGLIAGYAASIVLYAVSVLLTF